MVTCGSGFAVKTGVTDDTLIDMERCGWGRGQAEHQCGPAGQRIQFKTRLICRGGVKKIGGRTHARVIQHSTFSTHSRPNLQAEGSEKGELKKTKRK